MYGSTYNPVGAGAPPVPFEQPKSLYRFGELALWSTFYFPGATALANSVNRLFTTPRGDGSATLVAEDMGEGSENSRLVVDDQNQRIHGARVCGFRRRGSSGCNGLPTPA